MISRSPVAFNRPVQPQMPPMYFSRQPVHYNPMPIPQISQPAVKSPIQLKGKTTNQTKM